MSTSFKVLPGSELLPSFGEFIDLSTIRLQQFLRNVGIKAQPRIQVILRSKDLVRRVDLRDPAKWDNGWYAWFSVPPVEGGTDMERMQVQEETKQLWEEEAKYNRRIAERRGLIRSCLKLGYYWVIRRTMGQSATINLTYGLLAASLVNSPSNTTCIRATRHIVRARRPSNQGGCALGASWFCPRGMLLS